MIFSGLLLILLFGLLLFLFLRGDGEPEDDVAGGPTTEVTATEVTATEAPEDEEATDTTAPETTTTSAESTTTSAPTTTTTTTTTTDPTTTTVVQDPPAGIEDLFGGAYFVLEDIEVTQEPSGVSPLDRDPSLHTQRVALARWTPTDPDPIVLDEFLSGDLDGYFLIGDPVDIDGAYIVSVSTLESSDRNPAADYQSALFATTESTVTAHQPDTTGAFTRLDGVVDAWFINHTDETVERRDPNDGFELVDSDAIAILGEAHIIWLIPDSELAVAWLFFSEFARITATPPATPEDPAGYALVEEPFPAGP